MTIENNYLSISFTYHFLRDSRQMFTSKGTAVFHEILQIVMSLKIKYQWSQFHHYLIKASQEINNIPICALCHQGNICESL